MSDMTLDEARRIMERTVWSGMGDQPEALRVILAALPPPEKRTPGQTYHENSDQEHSWANTGDVFRAQEEAGALAVLREHAVEFALTDEMMPVIADLVIRGTYSKDVRAAVRARLEVKP